MAIHPKIPMCLRPCAPPAVMLAVLIFLPASSRSADTQSYSWPDIVLHVRKYHEDRIEDLRSVRAELLAEERLIKQGDKVWTLLESSGIRPDTDSFGLVYEMNPNLSSLRDLTPDTKMQLPRATGPPELREALSQGYIVDVRLYAGHADTLADVLRSILESADDLKRLPSAAFGGSEEKIDTVKHVASAIKSIQLMHRVLVASRLHVDLKMLRQLVPTVKLLSAILARADATEARLTEGDRTRIGLIDRYLRHSLRPMVQAKASGGIPERWGRARVTVRAVDSHNGQLVKHLRAHCIGAALYGDEQFAKFKISFRGQLPASEWICEGWYVFWASDQQGSVATDAPTVRVFDEGPPPQDPIVLYVSKERSGHRE